MRRTFVGSSAVSLIASMISIDGIPEYMIVSAPLSSTPSQLMAIP